MSLECVTSCDAIWYDPMLYHSSLYQYQIIVCQLHNMLLYHLHFGISIVWYIEGILPKEPYPPCLRMAEPLGRIPSNYYVSFYFQRFYADVFPKGDAAGFASHVFKVLDRDGNGGIDFREFIMAVSITQTGTRDDRTKWLFELFDIDGTGFIKRAELVDMIEVNTQYQRGWNIFPPNVNFFK